MKKPIIIVGPAASGKSLKAQALAQCCGYYATVAWGDSLPAVPVSRINAVIIEEVPHPDLWPVEAWKNIQLIGANEPGLQLILVLSGGCDTPISEECFDVLRMQPKTFLGTYAARDGKEGTVTQAAPSARYTGNSGV